MASGEAGRFYAGCSVHSSIDGSEHYTATAEEALALFASDLAAVVRRPDVHAEPYPRRFALDTALAEAAAIARLSTSTPNGAVFVTADEGELVASFEVQRAAAGWWVSKTSQRDDDC